VALACDDGGGSDGAGGASGGDGAVAGSGAGGSAPDLDASASGQGGARADGSAPAPDAAAALPDVGPPPDEDLEMQAEDFDCMLDWSPVRRFYVTNKLGRLDEALAVANDPEGGTYPPGTVIQLVPQEAMVKRRVGWNPTTNDWEFFFLDFAPDGAVSIRTRGAEETVNAFGGNCFECHSKAAPQWDLVCEQDHGCDPLPLSEQVIRNLQQADARCD
jgi:hypothetical protein